jgi:hypothetical protein
MRIVNADHHMSKPQLRIPIKESKVNIGACWVCWRGMSPILNSVGVLFESIKQKEFFIFYFFVE